MPLSRYRIRSEYSLANPDLYRAADKDDPEGLLEGVAMAGLVGIIRQLGDLAEFAAEVFHDLHEDVLATAARSHELVMRVRQLEREVPLIEKMYGETNCANFMYNPGLEWHVHIHNNQNHFTQGDLPRFIRSAYEDCRSPPRLFVLDRFDNTGAGACLKRFTDPSFFKLEWARSELMKAEKEQRDHKARRLKRRSQRQGNGEVKEARLASHTKFRVPIEAENRSKSSIPSSSANSSCVFEQETLDLLKQENEDMLTASSSLLSGQEGSQLKGALLEDSRIGPVLPEPSYSKENFSTIDSRDLSGLHSGLENDLKEAKVLADDSASETDNFMDAVTTMDSEVETDMETKPCTELDAGLLVKKTDYDALLPQTTLENSIEADVEQLMVKDAMEEVLIEDPAEERIEGEVKGATGMAHCCLVGDLMSEELHRAEPIVLAHGASTIIQDKESSLFVSSKGVPFHAQGIDASSPKSPSGASSSGVEDDVATMSLVAPFPAQAIDASPGRGSDGTSSSDTEEDPVAESPVPATRSIDVSPPKSPSVCASIPNVKEDTVVKPAKSSLVDISRVSAEGKSFIGLDESDTISCSNNNGVSTSVDQISTSSPIHEEKVSLSAETCFQPESNYHISSSLGNLEASYEVEECRSGHSAQLNKVDSDGPASPKESPRVLGTVMTRKRWQINTLFDKAIVAPDLKSNGSLTSDSEDVDSPKKPSLNSSPSSSIHSIRPIKWAIGSSTLYLSDNEADGLQGSLSSLSSSSSTLSSPRPSVLATTLQKLYISETPLSSFLPSRSADSPPPKIGVTTELRERVSPVRASDGRVVSPTSELSVHSSPHSACSPMQPFFDSLSSLGINHTMFSPEKMAESLLNQDVGVNNLEAFPPPPPLPPLAWRISKNPPSAGVHPSVPTDLPIPMPVQGNTELCADEASQVSTSSTTAQVVLSAGVLPTRDYSMQFVGNEKFLSKSEPLNENLGGIHTCAKPAEIEKIHTPAFITSFEASQEESPPVAATFSNFKREKIITAPPDSHLREKLVDNSSGVVRTNVLQTQSMPTSLGKKRLESETKGDCGVLPLVSHGFLSNLEDKESSSDVMSSFDINRLRRRSKWALTSSTASSDDREVLLKQIRTRSFNLRSSSVEKVVAPRPVTNINVAAILEKANAIRQAFAGSDDEDDDEWSDA